MALDDLLNSFKSYSQGQVGLGPKPEDQPVPDSNVPYQLRGDYEEEMVPMPEVPGQYNLPGLQDFIPQRVMKLPEFEQPQVPDRNLELAQTPDTLVPGESAGIPTKSTQKSSIVSSLMGSLSKSPSFEKEILPQQPVTPYERKESPLGEQEQLMAQALQDREDRMNNSVRRAAANDISNALMYGMGIDYKINSTADNELKRLEDLKLKNLNEKLGLSGKVLGSEKSKMDLQNMGDLNDINSPISQTYRKGAKELLGDRISDEVLNQMTGAQINGVLGVDLGTIMDKMENRELKREQLAAAKEARILDRELKREQIEASKAARLNPMDKILLQDELKEEQQIKKENRKERSQIEKDLKTTESLVNLVKQAKDEFDKYSKSEWTGTGPLATLGGGSKYLSQETQKLDSLFKTLSLDSMVKAFSGMSKAVDTNAERAAFEATQPSLTNDDQVNKAILERQLKAAESLLKKQKEAIKRFDRSGNFNENVGESTVSQPETTQKQYAPGQQLRIKGKMYRVKEDGNTLEEI